MAVVCVIVVAVDRLVLSGHGVLRLVADALLYAALVTLWKAGDHMALLRILTQTLRRRKTHHAIAV
jgi:hypothetical protein